MIIIARAHKSLGAGKFCALAYSSIVPQNTSLVPRPIPLKSHRSGVFGDVRITSGGRDLSECADVTKYTRPMRF